MTHSPTDAAYMQRALELARLGEGYVEPNPMVGCVIARGNQVVGEGYHQQFGGPHAELEALSVSGEASRDATMYVTLEPCCHHGKTPPCTEAILTAGIARVVVALRDPFPKVDGGGIKLLDEAGITTEVGLLADEACSLNAPYLKLTEAGRSWVMAKWAMTLDGKIATRTGDSQWISNDQSRAIVHKIRGRVDAILVGSGTAHADDPLLTARPAGPRTATRIVLDSNATLRLDSQLVSTIDHAPIIIVVSPDAPNDKTRALTNRGCEVLVVGGDSNEARLQTLLKELGSRRLTNVLVEGGARVLGSFCDANLIDEAHIFLGPQVLGGADSPTAVAGYGVAKLAEASVFTDTIVEQVGSDLYIRGRRSTT